MDLLKLNSVEVDCVIGDLPEERDREQRLTVDVAMELDLAKAASTDALEDTVDYAALTAGISAALKAAKCRMIERAAQVVADVCLADARVKKVSVSVRKSGCVPGLGSAEVLIERVSR